VTFTENISIIDRTGNITVSATGIGPVTVTVTQGGVPLILNVTPPNQNVTASSGNTSFTVISNAQLDCFERCFLVYRKHRRKRKRYYCCGLYRKYGSTARTATISVTVTGLPVQNVTVSQAKSPIGIDEQVGQELSIYPNPTNGYFKIVPVTWDNGNLDIQVLDMHGRVILEQHYSGQKGI